MPAKAISTSPPDGGKPAPISCCDPRSVTVPSIGERSRHRHVGGDADVAGGDADVAGGDADVADGDADVADGDADVTDGDADVADGAVQAEGIFNSRRSLATWPVARTLYWATSIRPAPVSSTVTTKVERITPSTSLP